MSNSRTVVTISGTSRPDNYTSRVQSLVDDDFRRRGIEVEHFDARTLQLSFPGEPATDDVRRITDVVRGAQAVVITSPEYHGTFAAMTKLILQHGK